MLLTPQDYELYVFTAKLNSNEIVALDLLLSPLDHDLSYSTIHTIDNLVFKDANNTGATNLRASGNLLLTYTEVADQIVGYVVCGA